MCVSATCACLLRCMPLEIEHACALIMHQSRQNNKNIIIVRMYMRNNCCCEFWSASLAHIYVLKLYLRVYVALHFACVHTRARVFAAIMHFRSLYIVCGFVCACYVLFNNLLYALPLMLLASFIVVMIFAHFSGL